MKYIKKISNLSIAGVLAVGVLLLGFFAYREKIQADTILPGYATAHVGLNVTVPDSQSVTFTVKFTPKNGTGIYYFKTRNFTFETPGLNTVEWYIRKIPQGEYTTTVYSSDNELSGSPLDVELVNDIVNDTTDFELNLGEPIEQGYENTSDTGENNQTQLPAPEETINYESPTSTTTSQAGSIVVPGEVQSY